MTKKSAIGLRSHRGRPLTEKQNFLADELLTSFNKFSLPENHPTYRQAAADPAPLSSQSLNHR
ncbi:hypothetical protein [Burkholderia ubonensis]|uniref:hypothetical protein n=1 Tax=Burkholderia ubonensis TaxID=101571 RepID=UPI000B109DEA|nr:hypothetical protein [Burkholderia ubonensis]